MTTRFVVAVTLIVLALAPSSAASPRRADVPLPTWPLTVQIAAGAGKVTTEPAGIDCATTCTANFVSGSKVTLTAIPAAGGAVHAWGGACSGAQPTCVVTVTAATSVTVTFDPVRLTVTAQGSGGWVTSSGENSPDGIDCGVGSTCTAAFPIGTALTLFAIRTDDGALESWSGCTSATSVLCSVSLTGDTTVTAIFSKLALQIPVSIETDVDVSRSGDGEGEIAISPPGGARCTSHCVKRYPVGVRLRLTATPAGTSTFGGWTGGCGGASGATCAVGVVPGLSIGAFFQSPPAAAGGSGGGSGGGGGSAGGADTGWGGTGSSGSGSGPGAPSGDQGASAATAARIALHLHVRALRRDGGRKLSIVLVASRSAVARISVRGPGARALRKDAAIEEGRNLVVVPVPRTRPSGNQRVTIVLRDASGHAQSLSATVRLR
jgi:hypothetical protein